MKEVKLYNKKENGKVECCACEHKCIIPPGKRGICGVRENREGTLYSLVYGKTIAANTDPIEKKPLFHFLPGTLSFSIATAGCNMHCKYCQNADISQLPRERKNIIGREFLPEQVVQTALKNKCKTIAYTYTEPSIFWDYAYDTAKLAREQGIKNVFVTNGYFSRESFQEISEFMDAANVDLKSFSDKTYKEICSAKLQPVVDTILRMKAAGVWIEVTTLLITDLNDSKQELEEIANFIAECDPGIPWHISRFYPTYKMLDKPPTSVKSIWRAMEIGYEAGLHFVYAGNVRGDEGENTFCYSCGTRVIQRVGFQVSDNIVKQGKCPKCGAVIEGVWES
ncbi:MAG: AmmeMemoRadiSam system radical SAM enzyme [bacterium]